MANPDQHGHHEQQSSWGRIYPNAFILMEFLPGNVAMDASGGYATHNGEIPIPPQHKSNFYNEIARVQDKLNYFREGLHPGRGTGTDRAAWSVEGAGNDLHRQILLQTRFVARGIRDILLCIWRDAISDWDVNDLVAQMINFVEDLSAEWQEKYRDMSSKAGREPLEDH
ncbi:hypothetical protein VC83_09237 [Pseudogymnoascus destructans]|uniref:Uncharacterized protein n=1 Tax=Pseudogymnoascus destructans TaxID=655981 RepID=A0A176ZYZ3_9PEZI|nr:uncharacterized protein VC83_09237 [Pseudogymnoascus destructans]OAF54452.1 hypothetical protein VC83_09237 [Pseudogymnoascus destructans]